MKTKTRSSRDSMEGALRKKVMIFDINRFHFFVLLTWQFAIFFASQQIFPIFSNYVPEWQC
ncbi:hypothetical protein TELCIR_20911, partial [Teladorsagia circumcincta]